MSMDIDSEEGRRLARELAGPTGESMSEAVNTALRQRLERVRREGGSSLADRLVAIGKACAPLLKEPYRSAEHGELLYDDRGDLE
jgi:antitoxin VapB